MIKKIFAQESGVTAIEYGFLAALIALAIVVGSSALGTSLNSILDGVANFLQGAIPQP